MTGGDHYRILGVSRSASAEEIRVAYRRLILRHHPDQSPGEESARLFTLVREAYEVLGDPERRKHHDFLMEQQATRRREEDERRASEARVRQAAAAASSSRPSPRPSPRPAPKPAASPAPPIPTVSEQVTRMNLVFTRGKLADAERLANEIRARAPREAAPYAVLGDIARGRGKLDEAQRLYAFAMQFEPSNRLYARRYEELLGTLSRRPSPRGEFGRDEGKPTALLVALPLVLSMALYVAIAREPVIVPAGGPFSTFTIGAAVMLFLAGVITGAALSAAHLVDRFVSISSNSLGRPGPALALASVALVSFWAAAGLYTGLGFVQKAFNLSATRAILATIGLVLLFASASALSPSVGAGTVLVWGGNLAYVGTLAGWTVADSLKRP